MSAAPIVMEPKRASKEDLAAGLKTALQCNNEWLLRVIDRHSFFADKDDFLAYKVAVVIDANGPADGYKNNPTIATCIKGMQIADKDFLYKLSGNETTRKRPSEEFRSDAVILQNVLVKRNRNRKERIRRSSTATTIAMDDEDPADDNGEDHVDAASFTPTELLCEGSTKDGVDEGGPIDGENPAGETTSVETQKTSAIDEEMNVVQESTFLEEQPMQCDADVLSDLSSSISDSDADVLSDLSSSLSDSPARTVKEIVDSPLNTSLSSTDSLEHLRDSIVSSTPPEGEVTTRSRKRARPFRPTPERVRACKAAAVACSSSPPPRPGVAVGTPSIFSCAPTVELSPANAKAETPLGTDGRLFRCYNNEGTEILLGSIAPTVELPPQDNKGGAEAALSTSPDDADAKLDNAIAIARRTAPINPLLQFVKNNTEADSDEEESPKVEPLAKIHQYVAASMTDASKFPGVAHAEKLALIKKEWYEIHGPPREVTKGNTQANPPKTKAAVPKRQAKEGARKKRTRNEKLKTSPPFGCGKCRGKVNGCANCNPVLMKKYLLRMIQTLKEQALDGFEKKVAAHERQLEKHCSHLS